MEQIQDAIAMALLKKAPQITDEFNADYINGTLYCMASKMVTNLTKEEIEQCMNLNT